MTTIRTQVDCQIWPIGELKISGKFHEVVCFHFPLLQAELNESWSIDISDYLEMAEEIGCIPFPLGTGNKLFVHDIPELEDITEYLYFYEEERSPWGISSLLIVRMKKIDSKLISYTSVPANQKIILEPGQTLVLIDSEGQAFADMP